MFWHELQIFKMRHHICRPVQVRKLVQTTLIKQNSAAVLGLYVVFVKVSSVHAIKVSKVHVRDTI